MTGAAMVESSALVGDAASLRTRFDEQGYLFFRSLVPSADVIDVRRAMLGVLRKAGWVVASDDPLEASPGADIHREGDAEWFPVYAELQALQVFHEFALNETVRKTVGALVGADILVHPRKIARVTYPGSSFPTPRHQDFPLIQGSADTYTLWVPFGDCPRSMGSIRILPGSHRTGLMPLVPRPGVGGLGVECDAAESAFVGADFHAGDVLLFHSFTIHEAPPNDASSLRLSADYRYQARTDPVCQGSLLPHGFGLLPGYDELTRDWSSGSSVAYPDRLHVTPVADPMGSFGEVPSRHVARPLRAPGRICAHDARTTV